MNAFFSHAPCSNVLAEAEGSDNNGDVTRAGGKKRPAETGRRLSVLEGTWRLCHIHGQRGR